MIPAFLFILTAAVTLRAQDAALYGKLWGKPVAETPAAGPGHEQFTPADRPDYKNRILSHILGLNETLAGETVVIRVAGSPARDYVFIRTMLQIVMEDWGTVSGSAADGINRDLERLLGKGKLQRDGQLDIISYATPATKAMFYKKKTGDNRYFCRVYLYNRKLFRLLLFP